MHSVQKKMCFYSQEFSVVGIYKKKILRTKKKTRFLLRKKDIDQEKKKQNTLSTTKVRFKKTRLRSRKKKEGNGKQNANYD